jgi:hypothetical protein
LICRKFLKKNVLEFQEKRVVLFVVGGEMIDEKQINQLVERRNFFCRIIFNVCSIADLNGKRAKKLLRKKII